MKFVHIIAFVLVIVGALNWLLFGLMGWEIGNFLPGGMTGMAAKVIYVLVGLSGIYLIFTHKSDCKHCAAGMKGADMPMGGGM